MYTGNEILLCSLLPACILGIPFSAALHLRSVSTEVVLCVWTLTALASKSEIARTANLRPFCPLSGGVHYCCRCHAVMRSYCESFRHLSRVALGKHPQSMATLASSGTLSPVCTDPRGVGHKTLLLIEVIMFNNAGNTWIACSRWHWPTCPDLRVWITLHHTRDFEGLRH